MMADCKGLGEHVERLRSPSFSIGACRPPSEGGSASLLLRVSENCPWNRCTFCKMYKGHRFVYRPVEEITADIDRVAAMRDELAAVSSKLGMGGKITRDLGAALLAAGRDLVGNPGFVTVFNWLASGARTAFRQDYEGHRFPQEKPLVLERIREGLAVEESMHVHARQLMAVQSL